MKDKYYLLLDTNIYLHYTDFEQINWKEVIGLSDCEICILVTPTNIREIDKIKDREHKAKVKSRARKIASRFGDYFLYGVKGKVEIIKCKDPLENQFNNGVFNSDVNDDWLILSALNFKSENKCEVYIVSADTHILIKAKEQGLNFIKIPEKYIFNEDLTEEEKELIETKKELSLYKNRISKLEIRFENNSNFIKLSKGEILDYDRLFEKRLNNKRVQNTYLPEQEEQQDYVSTLFRNLNAFAPTIEQAKSYNKKLDEYFKQYEEYIKTIAKDEVINSRLNKINLYLVNSGTALSGKLDIFIGFPDNINLYSKKVSVQEVYINEPIAPKKPQSSLEANFVGLSSTTIESMKNFINPIVGGKIFWDLSKKLNKKTFYTTTQGINHGLILEIDLEYDIYIDKLECGNFPIKYKIIDANNPKVIEGDLNIIVD